VLVTLPSPSAEFAQDRDEPRERGVARLHRVSVRVQRERRAEQGALLRAKVTDVTHVPLRERRRISRHVRFSRSYIAPRSVSISVSVEWRLICASMLSTISKFVQKKLIKPAEFYFFIFFLFFFFFFFFMNPQVSWLGSVVRFMLRKQKKRKIEKKRKEKKRKEKKRKGKKRKEKKRKRKWLWFL
jgi:hypothetical protein